MLFTFNIIKLLLLSIPYNITYNHIKCRYTFFQSGNTFKIHQSVVVKSKCHCNSGHFSIWVKNMGAEQSALLACTQTGIHEDRLEMDNSKLFFQLYFDRMPQPVTGPVTEALLHLVDKVNVAGANNGNIRYLYTNCP